MMIPSTCMLINLFYFVLYLTTNWTCAALSNTIVIEINGDCATLGKKIADEHGHRYVREIFQGFCELEEDPSSGNHTRYRRALDDGIHPEQFIGYHSDVLWAESQVPKIRRKREFVFNDPQWNSMWYLIRHSQVPSLPDLNVTGAWTMGYTGRGKVVTFLDDGLEFDHPDLQENYDHEASTDINGDDDDPTPRYEPTNENKHGTRCAGEVAAKINNNICGVGIAYHASVGGIRMLDGDVTDSVEARSLRHRPDHVDIYSASWGPDDNGLVVDGPGRLAKKAFENGALNGRGGKGSIFVWASGNGGRQSDSCACDGYITSIYTIAISATTEHGDKPWYLEECSATLASAYSSGQMNSGERDIYTTDLNHACTSHHTGTSAAAPLAAAIYALVLEANPSLTWRDIMHITVLGSRPYAIPSNTNIVRNAAGFNASSRFGFGLMDAGLMTWYASGWKNVPPMTTCESVTSNPKRLISARSTQTFTLKLLECKDNGEPQREVNYIEQIQVFVTLNTDRRGEIEIYLYSPSNTRTQLLPKRERDQSNKGFQDWPFLTVQLWGEVPHGQWKLEIVNTGGGSATLLSWKLLVHGTREYPLSPRTSIVQTSYASDRSSCHAECKTDDACGNTDTSCTSCRHYKQPLDNDKFRCVSICPEGTYASDKEKLCLPCHSQCRSCRNATETSCISCKTDLFLVHDATTCVESCPEQYFTDHHLRKCVRCKAGCASCDASSHICTSCPDGYALKNTDCVKASKECDATSYFDFIQSDCRECHSKCLTCSGPQASQCKTCDKRSEYPYLQTHSCVSSCSSGYFLSEKTFQCLPCHESCLNCTSSSETSCLSCKIGYVYLPDEHRCEKHLGKPYYIDLNTGESHTCHSSCTQCKGPEPTDCIACNALNEVLLLDGHCVNQCPVGTFKKEQKTIEIETNVCLPCENGCRKCSDENQCQLCEEDKGFRLINSKCKPICQEGTFLSGDRCELCSKTCLTCSNSTNCLSCNKDLYLFNQQCVDECPERYYTSNQQCLACHPICQTCKGSTENDCLSCSKGFEFDEREKQCVNLCPNGNYFDQNDDICKMCTNNCLECLHPGSYCRQCIYPMSLDTFTHRCLPCCTTNQTTNDCCQCPSSWDGYCLHPLVNPSPQTSHWFDYSLGRLRTKFHDLNSSNQTIIIVALILILISIIICFLSISLRQVCQSKSSPKHDNIEYVMLQNVDDDNDDNTEEHNSKYISANGHNNNHHHLQTTISLNHVEET